VRHDANVRRGVSGCETYCLPLQVRCLPSSSHYPLSCVHYWFLCCCCSCCSCCVAGFLCCCCCCCCRVPGTQIVCLVLMFGVAGPVVKNLLLFLQMRCLPSSSRYPLSCVHSVWCCFWLLCCCCSCCSCCVAGSCVAAVLLLLLSCARSDDSMFDGHLMLYLLCSMRDWCTTMLMFGVTCPVVRHTVQNGDDMFAG
jgi:hypothetical protein